LRGSAVELGRWNKEGVQLDKRSDKTYSKNIKMKENALFEFKLVLNDQKYYPIINDGYGLQEIEIKSDTTIKVEVFEWKMPE
jgi:hypothetical protein